MTVDGGRRPTTVDDGQWRWTAADSGGQHWQWTRDRECYASLGGTDWAAKRQRRIRDLRGCECFSASSRLDETFPPERNLFSPKQPIPRLDEDSSRKRAKFPRKLAWASHSRLSEITCRSTLNLPFWVAPWPSRFFLSFSHSFPKRLVTRLGPPSDSYKSNEVWSAYLLATGANPLGDSWKTVSIVVHSAWRLVASAKRSATNFRLATLEQH
ncbi:hypothetical protein DEO72_LG7g973 [Vigna unguiculata]|uniref:Uncharacterized protein n=1 Tax=Vigna unguiculata TaxID=3917 RepID=A0A4D6ME26_VIGUN|nr:hypothetical protein DEO72_LG7g973 [Vigna unguiculata]